MRRLIVVGSLVFAGMACFGRVTFAACSFPAWPSQSMSVRLAAADTALFAKVHSARRRVGKRPGQTTFEILKVLKSSDATFKPGGKVSLSYGVLGNVGDLFMVMGPKPLEKNDTRYFYAFAVTPNGYKYVVGAPDVKLKQRKRLGYFLKFLETPDPFSAADAYREFERSDLGEIRAIAESLPRNKLRTWLADSKLNPARISMYAIMLGVCGDHNDAELLKKMILAVGDDFRLGTDGVITGYLLLTGPKGLDLVDKSHIKNERIAISETYAAMQAIRYLWYDPEGTIGKERLRKSMRSLLNRPELAELVIPELRRFKDWKMQDRIMRLYDDRSFGNLSFKIAIVQFMLAGASDFEKGTPASSLPPHVVRAKANLAVLEKKDPKTFRFAKRFFIVDK